MTEHTAPIGASHLMAASLAAGGHARVLNHADTFGVFDQHGDICPGGLGEEGLYHEGTRFLSRLTIELEGCRPFYLDSAIAPGRGIRTLAAGEARFNPMGYHTGGVWPHDNALIAQGLTRHGCADEAMRIQQAMFQAGLHFELQRMPELFCGFARATEEAPVPYPLACAPQAWAAGSVLLLLQAGLGLQVDGCSRRVVFSAPRLPDGLDELSIYGLAVSNTRVDLRIVRHGPSVGIEVLNGDRTVEVLVR